MPAKTARPFGTWPSPITAEQAAHGSRRIGTLQAGQNAVWWTEGRPQDQGRQVLVRASPDGRVEDALPKLFSARSRVHEYGGGEFLVSDSSVFFVNDKDQQIYELEHSSIPRQVTKQPNTRFADIAHDTSRTRLIAVAEVHASKGHALPRNALTAIQLTGKRGQVAEIAGTHDFYASPRLSADGKWLAFIAWDLPDMPWDSAALYLAEVRADGQLGRPQHIAGSADGAVYQPEWGPDGHLYFTWDKTGWGRLYRWNGKSISRVHGTAGSDLWRPHWVFGTRCYALHPDGRFAAVSSRHGMPLLEVGKLAGNGTPVSRTVRSTAARIDDPVVFGDGFAALVSSPMATPTVMKIGRGGLQVLAEQPHELIAPGDLSQGEVVTFKNAKRQAVYAIHYPPVNARHRGPKGAAPPALVLAHGGPTSMTDAGLKPRIQFYTSRGFAVLDVNYAGSTGYGRAYRQRLDGQWGIADVADCTAGARHLAKAGLADAKKIAIAGGSAGGYTTLMALATTQVFAAGSSHYGISDLKLLLEHTHKFESGYLHRLLGTTPSKWKDVFAKRSPLNLIAGITAPVILFQGLDDKVVPPEQSRIIVDKLRQRGIDVEYHEFAGEGHGFRKAVTIIAVLEAELAFLQRVLRLK